MRTSTLARQLQLLERLYSPSGCTIEQLAAELECSERTVFRYLRNLEEAGFEIRMDESSCYQLAPHFGAQPAKLRGEELLTLALVLRTSPLAVAPDLAALLQQATGKLLTKAPADQRKQIERVLQACQVQFPEHGGATGRIGVLRTILMALANAAVVQIALRRPGEEKTVLDQIRPVSLHVTEDQWSIAFTTSSEESLVVPLPQILAVRFRDEVEADEARAKRPKQQSQAPGASRGGLKPA
jgi:predicted DNA-binding transcriptional regulator YafY